MFHTYVVASTSRAVDFHRDLLRQAIKAMNETMAAGVHPLDKERAEACGMTLNPMYGAQWIWDDYCSRHYEKYGVCFQPDDDPAWDT